MSAASHLAISIAAQTDKLSRQLVDRYFQIRPEFARISGEAGKGKCIEDAKYHLRYLVAALETGKSSLFLDYAHWAQQLLVNLGLPADELQHYLVQLREILKKRFPNQADQLVVESFLEPAIISLGYEPPKPRSHLGNESEADQLAARFLDLLLVGDRANAIPVITGAVDRGMSIKDVYLHVFQPVQYEIGRLWHLGKISVAQEHLCTAVTQWAMSRLYPLLFAGERGSKRIVAACVSGDLHEIGLRMVTDLMELDGWNTLYLGASVPGRAVVEMVAKEQSHVLALSATMGFHLGPLAQTIRLLREDPSLAHVKVLVGGRPFLVEPTLVESVGADAMANDAGEASSVANALIEHWD